MNPSTALARVLVDEFLRCGLADIVLAPGSRSAPLALAAHDAADGIANGIANGATPKTAGRAIHEPARLRLHVRIDERSAAYLALGLGKAQGWPAVAVCTSGTAAASFHPAVVEASQAGVPLLVLTADRPPELRDTGANQTIDQVKLYGDAVRWFCEVGVGEARAGAVAHWRSMACRAWASATGDDPGPVHLNLAFREPLVPDGSPDWPESLGGRPGGAPWTVVGRCPQPQGVHAPEPAPEELPRAERGLVVAGDDPPDPAAYVTLAQQRGWPVLAEPTSGARYGPNALSAYPYLLGSPGFADGHRPDVVVTLGRPGLSRALLALLETAREHIVVSRTPRWADPTRSATRVTGPAPGTDSPEPERTSEGPPARSSGWLREWLHADSVARSAVDRVLDAQPGLTEPGLARDLAAVIPDGGLLFAGSSMPIRDLDRTMRPRRGLRVLGNRGASGIDGSVSAAAGAALAHGGRSYALLGDLALLHDQNGLVLGPEEPSPDLTIVVVNNNGGGIFSSLPQASYGGPFERVFGTPHGVQPDRIAATAGIPYTRLERPGDLSRMNRGEGLRLVEARTDRATAAQLHHDLQRAADRALPG